MGARKRHHFVENELPWDESETRIFQVQTEAQQVNASNIKAAASVKAVTLVKTAAPLLQPHLPSENDLPWNEVETRLFQPVRAAVPPLQPRRHFRTFLTF